MKEKWEKLLIPDEYEVSNFGNVRKARRTPDVVIRNPGSVPIESVRLETTYITIEHVKVIGKVDIPVLKKHTINEKFCFYCARTLGKKKNKETVDHVIPTSRGGENIAKNRVKCCKSCNSMKADYLPEELHAVIGEYISTKERPVGLSKGVKTYTLAELNRIMRNLSSKFSALV